MRGDVDNYGCMEEIAGYCDNTALDGVNNTQGESTHTINPHFLLPALSKCFCGSTHWQRNVLVILRIHLQGRVIVIGYYVFTGKGT